MSSFLLKLTGNQIFRYLAISVAILLGSFIIAEGAVKIGVGIFALVGVPFILLSIYDYRIGVVFLFLYGSLLFQVARMMQSDLPFGILFDLLICLMFLSLLLSSGKKNIDFKIKEPISRMYILFFIYFGMEVLNPNSMSVVAWVNASRSYTLLLLYFIFIGYQRREKDIRHFIILFFSIALLAAVYGLQQEVFGLREFEWKFIYDSPTRFKMFYNWGHMRVFSILSDPTAFGIFMAFSGLSSLILAFGPFSTGKKVLFITLTLFAFISMSYSGTRTAYALVVIGVVFFIILNLRNKKVLAGSMVLVMLFLILIFGPFYGGPIKRIRSTFDISGDASMEVRDIKRIRFQSYIQSHPLGGGVNMAGSNGLKYAPGHYLAGDFDPDSGYLRTALELGWIGLIISMALNATVVFKGISNNYTLKNKRLLSYNLAFLVPFFGLTVANYTQDALVQKPINMVVIFTYALMVNLKSIDNPSLVKEEKKSKQKVVR